MKSIICTLALFICAIVSVNAQSYRNVICGNCRGAGGRMTVYGPVCCQGCGGYGYISVPVQSDVAFRGAANNGTYTRTSNTVGIACESGTSKGYYDVYLKGGRQYINFYNNWVCIQGVSSFAYSGNRYFVKRQ